MAKKSYAVSSKFEQKSKTTINSMYYVWLAMRSTLRHQQGYFGMLDEKVGSVQQ